MYSMIKMYKITPTIRSTNIGFTLDSKACNPFACQVSLKCFTKNMISITADSWIVKTLNFVKLNWIN